MSNGYQPPGGAPGQPTYPGQGQPPYPQQGQPQYPGQGQQPYPQQGQPPYPGQGQPPYPQGQPPYPGQGQQPYPGQGQQPYGQQPGQPPYGQPGQQPGQSPYGMPPQDGYQGPEIPPKKNHTVLIIVIAVIVVAALALGAIFFFKGRMGGGSNNAELNANPEAYLQAALENTSENRAEAPSPLPEFQDFSGAPLEQEFYFQVRNIMGSPELSGFSLTMNSQVDVRAERMLLDLSVGYGPLTLSNNQLYLSGDLIAVSIPDLYSRYRYITIDTATFNSDWNRSLFGAEFGTIGPDFDLRDIISELFALAATDTSLDIDPNLFTRQLSERTDRLFDEASFTTDGTETITINGQSQEVTKLTYTFSSTQTAAYVSDILDIMGDFIMDYYGQLGDAMYNLYGYNPYSDLRYAWQDMTSELDGLTYPSGMKMAYYVNSDQLVNRIELYDLDVRDAYSSDSDKVRVGFTLDMGGESSLGEYTMLDIWLINVSDEELHVYFEGTATQEGATAFNKGEFSISVDTYEPMAVFYDIQWEPENSNGGQMKMDFELALENRTENVGVYLSGNLYDLDNEYRLDNGAVDIMYNGSNIFGLDFGYMLRTISGVEIDLGSSISMFDLDLEEFAMELQSGLMGLAYGLI